MRFIRKKHIVTTVFNKDLTEIDEIKTVFINLQKYRIEFSMKMSSVKGQTFNYINLNFEKVRAQKVYEDSLDLIAFKDGAQIKMKQIPFSDIEEVNATTIKHEILDIDSDVNRFELLDL